MPKRKSPLVSGEIYHIFSKSIADFNIFRNVSEYERMKDVFRYYKIDNMPLRFSSQRSGGCTLTIQLTSSAVRSVFYKVCVNNAQQNHGRSTARWTHPWNTSVNLPMPRLVILASSV